MHHQLAPIALFCYNRLNHLKQVVDYLSRNSEAACSLLYVFCDGPKSASDLHVVQQVHQYIDSITGFKQVIVSKKKSNVGLATSIIDGVTQVLSQHETLIVLEDDLLTSPFFLQFMNEALDLYQGDSNVGSIQGYSYNLEGPLPETFFVKGADCWGWATWRRAWKCFDNDSKYLLKQIEDGNLVNEFNRFYPNNELTNMLSSQADRKIDSWAIRWIASSFLNNMFALHPRKSLVVNIGLDGSGTHGDNLTDSVVLSDMPIQVERIHVSEEIAIAGKLRQFFHKFYGNKKISLSKKIRLLFSNYSA